MRFRVELLGLGLRVKGLGVQGSRFHGWGETWC